VSTWQRFSVELEGHDEPVIVQTNGLDWATVQIDPNAPKAMDMTFRVVHSALLRAGVDVSRDYRIFLGKELAGIPDSLDADDEAGMLDPTSATPSGG
jgi:hypothetical protein